MGLSRASPSSLLRRLCVRGRWGKDSVEVPLLGPPSQPGVDGVPLTEPWRSAPPRAAVLGDRQDGLEHVQVRQAASAALSRETRRKEGVLGFGEFHP